MSPYCQQLSRNFIIKLKRTCPQSLVLQASSEKNVYKNDALNFLNFPPDGIFIPKDVHDLIKGVRICLDNAVPVTVRGGGTGLSGGSVTPFGGMVIHVSKLKKLLSVEQDALTCWVEPSIAVMELNRQLAQYGLVYPPDPSSGVACTVGGNIAENAAGVHGVKWGTTSRYLAKVEILDSQGHIQCLEHPADIRLFCGSEGTLGIVVRAELRVRPLTSSGSTLLALFENQKDCFASVPKVVKEAGVYLSALECIDNRTIRLVEQSRLALGLPLHVWALLIELEGPEELIGLRREALHKGLMQQGALEVQIGSTPQERKQCWNARKAFGGLVGQLSPDVVIQDAVVPRSTLSSLLSYIYQESEAAGIPVVVVVHAAEGNVHPNLIFNSNNVEELNQAKALANRIMEKALSLGGTVSGEHGIGIDKKEILHHSLTMEQRQIQEAVLRSWNPKGLFNPGKMLEAHVPQT